MRNFSLVIVLAALVTSFAGTALAAGPDTIRILRYGNVESIRLWQSNAFDDLFERTRQEEVKRQQDGMPKAPATAAEPEQKQSEPR
jgi:hypothetical protein